MAASPGPAPRSPTDADVLVVGAGGIGCPAAWALVQSRVGRVTIVDPDAVELSNLPRQVLFTPEDVGRPKALAAAEALGGSAAGVRGVHERLDDTNEAQWLAGADVVLDATDGARTKDWLNQLAVRRGVPLVHAAGLRSEARLLAVPAGGRPCLACLFGRIEEEVGSCADLGVWNGVVGSIGLLAARAAVDLLRAPREPGPGYLVLDLETGRHMALGAALDPACPVCAVRGRVEPYPEAADCAVTDGDPEPGGGVHDVLDLRTERCPMNLLRARRALAAVEQGAFVDLHLGAEGAATVPDGVRALGHEIVASETRGDGLFLRVRARGREAPDEGAGLDEPTLQRFARQVVLPEVGEAGQRRLLEASVLLAGRGPAYEIAALYLAAAGVGRLVLDAPGTEVLERVRVRAAGRVEQVGEDAGADIHVVAWAGDETPPDEALPSPDTPALVLSGSPQVPVLRADWDDPLVAEPGAVYGALLADAVQRRIVTGRTPLEGVPLGGLTRGGPT